MIVAEIPLAERLKTETRVDHELAETSEFMSRLLDGELGLPAYARYLQQYAYVYAALEDPAATPSGPGFVTDRRLHRLPAIEHDLAALGSPDWRETEPLAATMAYGARIRDAGRAGPIHYLGHHYTRYLGDLSGGQIIAAMLRRHYGAGADQLTFFSFDEIGAAVPYKRRYREHLNSLGLDEAQTQHLVHEVRAAFRLNAAIFAELDAAIA